MTKREEEPKTIRFLRGAIADGWTANYADDEKIALLAVCVKHQQDAGFREAIDLREAPCPNCKAPGFNTGWGYFQHTCGAEVTTDGEDVRGCESRAVAAP